MPDSFQPDAADELDAMPPELRALHRRLDDDSAAWLRQLPAAESLARFARATPQQSTSAVTQTPYQSRSQQGTIPMNESTPTAQPTRKMYRVFVPSLVAVVVVILLAAIFVHFHNGTRSTQVGGQPTMTAGTTGCHYHAALPAGTDIGTVAMTSADEGWAVGGTVPADGHGSGVIMHYTNCQWRAVGATYPNIQLTSLVMLSASDGWITGGADDGSQQLLLHYVTGSWQPVTIPGGLAAGGSLDKIVMVAADEGWVEVGYPKDFHGITHYRLLHYKHGTWTTVSSPIAYIADISSAATDDLWIVGSPQFTDGTTVLAHYSKGTWSQQAGPTRLEWAQLHMTAPTAGVVVFSLYGQNNIDQTMKNVAWHYNGAAWSPLDLGGDRTGQDLRLLSDTQGWAFSKTYSKELGATTSISGAAYESNGQWQTVTWPLTNIIGVSSISRVADDEYWAAGFTIVNNNGYATSQSVFLHYSNGAWSEIGQ